MLNRAKINWIFCRFLSQKHGQSEQKQAIKNWKLYMRKKISKEENDAMKNYMEKDFKEFVLIKYFANLSNLSRLMVNDINRIHEEFHKVF